MTNDNEEAYYYGTTEEPSISAENYAYYGETNEPTPFPTPRPTSLVETNPPTPNPTSLVETNYPTAFLTLRPTKTPTAKPTIFPSVSPSTLDPSSMPTDLPSIDPTGYPTFTTNTTSNSEDDDTDNSGIIIGLSITGGIIILGFVGFIIHSYKLYSKGGAEASFNAATSSPITDPNDLQLTNIDTSASFNSQDFHTAEQGRDSIMGRFSIDENSSN